MPITLTDRDPGDESHAPTGRDPYDDGGWDYVGRVGVPIAPIPPEPSGLTGLRSEFVETASVSDAFYEIANQLLGYIDRTTPEREARFLRQTGMLASAFGDRFAPLPERSGAPTLEEVALALVSVGYKRLGVEYDPSIPLADEALEDARAVQALYAPAAANDKENADLLELVKDTKHAKEVESATMAILLERAEHERGELLRALFRAKPFIEYLITGEFIGPDTPMEAFTQIDRVLSNMDAGGNDGARDA